MQGDAGWGRAFQNRADGVGSKLCVPLAISVTLWVLVPALCSENSRVLTSGDKHIGHTQHLERAPLLLIGA